MRQLETLPGLLKMEHLGYQLERLPEQAAEEEFNYREFLCRALQHEWSGRHQRGLAVVERSENVILRRPLDVGKTHLPVALSLKVADAGHQVLFMSLDKLIATLMKARQENRLERQLQQLSYAQVLILDETCR